MNMTQVLNFKRLAEMQHYSRAAEQLGIAESSLSRSISSLESELGVRLFEKSGRNIRLTKYGRVFYDYIKNSVDNLNLGIRKLQSMVNPTSGEISLGFTFQLGPRIVPEMIRQFTSRNENEAFLLHLYQDTTAGLLCLLKNETCDIVLCSLKKNEPSVTFIPIFPSELSVAVPIGHPLALKETVEPKDLAQYPMILNTEKAEDLMDFFHQQHISPAILSHVQGECAIVGLVAVNCGISIVSRTAEIGNEPVKLIKVPALSRLNSPICLAYVKNRWVPPSVQAFIDFLLNDIRTSTV